MNVHIETERLIIRDPILEDFEEIWEMRNDVNVTKFKGGVTKLSKEEAYERHQKRCNNFENKPKEYAVILKETGAYLGYCGFQFYHILESIEIIYGFAMKYWGNGFAYEAAKAVLEFGTTELKINEIMAAVNYTNVASDKVLSKIGMEFIGEIEWPEQGLVKKYRYSK